MKAREEMRALLDMMDNEDVAPSAGLRIGTHELTSEPDGNTVKIQFIRPDGDETLPCVYYIHGGGDDDALRVRRHVPGVGQDHRRPGCGRRDDRLPQLPRTVVRSRGRAVPPPA